MSVTGRIKAVKELDTKQNGWCKGKICEINAKRKRESTSFFILGEGLRTKQVYRILIISNGKINYYNQKGSIGVQSKNTSQT
jgi:hypothetical protein